MPSTHSTHATAGDATGEILPLMCAVALYGPPVMFLLVPWLMLGVLLSAPFTLALGFLAAPLSVVALVAVLIGLVRRAAS